MSTNDIPKPTPIEAAENAAYGLCKSHESYEQRERGEALHEAIPAFKLAHKALLLALPQVEGCWQHHYGNNPKGGAVPEYIQLIREALCALNGEIEIEG